MILARAGAATALLGFLPSCGAVMHAFGDHVIFAADHPWHTVPAKIGVGVVGNVLPIALAPLFLVGLAWQPVLDFYAEVNTDAALGAGLLLGTPFWVVGLPFESSADDQDDRDDQSPSTGSRR